MGRRRTLVNDNENCRKCGYRTHLASGIYGCDYYVRTGRRRGRPVEECDEWKYPVKKRKRTSPMAGPGVY